ncbi:MULTISPECIES: exodeoxyribonuclease VII large subunit [unclassified Coleofasciculus]|uniref:exodeoxyribonuclease VII large subunit n=1 Tax=unclassified Coleofasciculus TaxID=2692782 RepID=UPI001880C2A5|nr:MULTISPECIES: exodeoxyribonuclease VII large subunit [unclassified Coleofasciculus]MBE9129938.1 exodeoxyribonuclease VII large subunit [Coleofasciculus sp. LEGE 07081]MBE9151391.1 exodeoxyribonuclease VII large subunit [Coleofasciculus sp. LEGE 07092]
MTPSFPNLGIPETALSVAGLTDYIQELLEQDDQLRQVWVIGEVSSANQHRSGMFFTLQDPDSKASIQCVVWNSQLGKLVQLPKAGEQLIVLGSIRVYPQRGQYKLMVWQALPAGEGLQALRYNQLRNRLQAEGLFALERKRLLPTHPQIIAVVTSPQAAAWGDIQRTLRQRYPGLQILLSPAQVQGELAPESMVKAIERVERDGRAQLLILSRGGGASEDLACFNDEGVVRAIANCAIPVLTGIGHQRDESLADLVADAYAHTPTAAAERAVPELAALIAEHQQRQQILHEATTRLLDASRSQLHHLNNRLRRLPIDRQLQQEQKAIAQKRQQLIQYTSWRLRQAHQHCQFLQQKLTTLDPNQVLKRGYALVRSTDGAIVRSAASVVVGEDLQIQLGEGQVKVKVTEVME